MQAGPARSSEHVEDLGSPRSGQTVYGRSAKCRPAHGAVGTVQDHHVDFEVVELAQSARESESHRLDSTARGIGVPGEAAHQDHPHRATSANTSTNRSIARSSSWCSR